MCAGYFLEVFGRGGGGGGQNEILVYNLDFSHIIINIIIRFPGGGGKNTLRGGDTLVCVYT